MFLISKGGLIVFLMILLSLGSQSLSAAPVKETLTFIDTQSFDSEFVASLANNDAPVTVDFYSAVTPNQIPQRLEKWMALAEINGGKISVTQPSGEMTPKNPLLLMGLFTGVWDLATKLKAEKSSYDMDDAVKNRDVNINLARNPQGGLIVQKVVFIPKEVK